MRRRRTATTIASEAKRPVTTNHAVCGQVSSAINAYAPITSVAATPQRLSANAFISEPLIGPTRQPLNPLGGHRTTVSAADRLPGAGAATAVGTPAPPPPTSANAQFHGSTRPAHACLPVA